MCTCVIDWLAVFLRTLTVILLLNLPLNPVSHPRPPLTACPASTHGVRVCAGGSACVCACSCVCMRALALERQASFICVSPNVCGYTQVLYLLKLSVPEAPASRCQGQRSCPWPLVPPRSSVCECVSVCVCECACECECAYECACECARVHVGKGHDGDSALGRKVLEPHLVCVSVWLYVCAGVCECVWARDTTAPSRSADRFSNQTWCVGIGVCMCMCMCMCTCVRQRGTERGR